MLDEHTEESLDRPEQRPVDHYRTMLLIVIARVFQFETLGQVPVKLDRSKLPNAANGVLDLDIDLGTVECRFALDPLIRYFPFVQSGCKLLFSRDPVFIRTKISFIFGSAANRKLEPHFVETVDLKNLDRKIETVG